MKICPNCGAENEDDIVECILCGYIFDDLSEYEDDEKYAEATEYTDDSILENDEQEVYVNNDIPQIKPAQASFSPYQQQAPVAVKKDSGKGIIIFFIILFLLIIGFFVVLFFKDDIFSQKPGVNNTSSSLYEANIDTTSTKITTTTSTTTTTTETTTKKTTTKKVTTTKETTTPAPTTVKATAPPATASISVDPQPCSGNGTLLLMSVSGNYSYFTYEVYADFEGQKNVLRKSGTSYDRSYLYEDGSTVSNFVFYVTPYNSDGVAGSRVSMKYNGEHMIYVPQQSASVSSCTRYGTIYSPSGSKVDGLTKSYLIDGGAATYERHDLTHGWHVTAVSEYYDGSTYWYELYDSDDGDYYGWVASYNISFY